MATANSAIIKRLKRFSIATKAEDAVVVMLAAACIDICAIDDESKYLILKDGRYVKIKCLRDKLPPDPESWPKLYDECQDGDHYMGYIRLKSLTSINDNVDARRRPKTRFYTIFRDRDYNLVKFHHRSGGTTTDKLGHQSHMHKYKLSDSYRGGDFYFSKGAEFYVVFKESRTFLRTVDLSEEPDMKQPLQLHNNLCNGLYYFATANFIYVVIAADNGFVYRRTPDLQTAGESAVSVHSSIAEVLKNGVPLQRRPWKSHVEDKAEFTKDSPVESDAPSAARSCCIRKRPPEERSIARLQLGVAGTLGGLVGGAIGAIVGLLAGGIIFATVYATQPGVTFSIGATVGSAVCTPVGAVLFCLIYYFYTCN